MKNKPHATASRRNAPDAGHRRRPAAASVARRGLTIFELLIVMMVLAILVALVISLGRHADLQTKRHQALADIGRWQEALYQYYLYAGQYPDAHYNGAVTNLLLAASTNANGEVLRALPSFMTSTNNLVDPWGHSYVYRVTDTNNAPQSYDIFSLGPDTNNVSGYIRLGTPATP